jgi:hypothetical protein
MSIYAILICPIFDCLDSIPLLRESHETDSFHFKVGESTESYTVAVGETIPEETEEAEAEVSVFCPCFVFVSPDLGIFLRSYLSDRLRCFLPTVLVLLHNPPLSYLPLKLLLPASLVHYIPQPHMRYLPTRPSCLLSRLCDFRQPFLLPVVVVLSCAIQLLTFTPRLRRSPLSDSSIRPIPQFQFLVDRSSIVVLSAPVYMSTLCHSVL